MIVSTGMASIAELDEMVSTARENGCHDITLLKCTSSYPASPKGTNLMTLPHMKQLFNCNVGISDHTMGIGVAVASIAMGSTVIEKHFTLSRADGGVDSAFSMEPDEMKQLVQEVNRAYDAIGDISYGVTEQEKAEIAFRRSLYIVKDMKKGDILTEENVRSIRPGLGLKPKYYDLILGKKVNRDIEKGTGLKWELIL